MKQSMVVILVALVLVSTLAPALSAYERPLLLIVDREEDVLLFVDAETYELVGSMRTGEQPQIVVVSSDHKSAYVSNLNDSKNTITEVNLVDLTKSRDIEPTPYWKPHDMALTRDGKKLFVTCEASRAVAEVDLKTGKATRGFETLELLTHMLALSPDEKTIYTANAASGNVSIIDVASGAVKTTVRSGPGCEGIAVSLDGSQVWAANRRADTITIIDTKTNKAIERIDCRGYPVRVVFTPDGKKALVSSPAANEINVFDASTRKHIDRVKTKPVPVGICVSPDSKLAFTVNNGEPSITVIDLETLEAVTSFPIGKFPFGIAYAKADSR